MGYVSALRNYPQVCFQTHRRRENTNISNKFSRRNKRMAKKEKKKKKNVSNLYSTGAFG